MVLHTWRNRFSKLVRHVERLYTGNLGARLLVLALDPIEVRNLF